MPVCSYVVFPEAGRTHALARTLAEIPGCEVEVAENRDMLLLVTSAATPDEDRALRSRVEGERDIQCLVMAFGEIDPETTEGDPVAAARAAERGGPEPGGSRGDPKAVLPVMGNGSGVLSACERERR